MGEKQEMNERQKEVVGWIITGCLALVLVVASLAVCAKIWGAIL
jgi:hypothetical protein